MNGRPEVTRSDGDKRNRGRCVAVAVCALTLVCLSACSRASGAQGQDKGYLEGTVRFLQEAQNPDGGFGATVGGPSDPDISAWAAIGLAADGINPQQQAKPGGRSVYTYLTEHAGELKETTNFERALLVADAAGTSPHDFGGVDLVARIMERRLPEGEFAHEAGEQAVHGVNDTVFAILALSPVQEPAVQAAVQKAAEWLIGAQSSKPRQIEGSWNAVCLERLPACDGPEGEGLRGEIDMTGAAIQALNAAGVRESGAQGRALEFLRSAQSQDGGFPEFLPQEPGEAPANAASTSWAVQALWSAGVSPETWHAQGGLNPLEFLTRLQHANGSIGYLPEEGEGSVWMTAYTAAAFGGQPLPIVDVPPPAPPAPASPAPSPLELAPARVSRPVTKSSHGTGVIAGGGGRGARLFSRPRPGGQGAGQGPLRESQSVTPSGGSATTRPKPAANARHAPAHHPSRPPRTAQAAQEADAPQSGPQIKGLLLDEPLASRAAPGLRSAEAAAGSWTTTAILVSLGLLVIAGARLERRRPGRAS
ncbi:MAG TPA: prenyltransferase/squalene oxidase repeat-containing protein [Solirubrobacteraceae bacterium]|nr:prenyltransferase/squalene oxidase repeat-containing protein [Solirubrobacteraceae bacterium]